MRWRCWVSRDTLSHRLASWLIVSIVAPASSRQSPPGPEFHGHQVVKSRDPDMDAGGRGTEQPCTCTWRRTGIPAAQKVPSPLAPWRSTAVATQVPSCWLPMPACSRAVQGNTAVGQAYRQRLWVVCSPRRTEAYSGANKSLNRNSSTALHALLGGTGAYHLTTAARVFFLRPLNLHWQPGHGKQRGWQSTAALAKVAIEAGRGPAGAEPTAATDRPSDRGRGRA